MVAFAGGLVAQTAPGSSTQTTPSTTLTIAGDVGTTLSLTTTDLKGLPRARVEVKTEDGTINTYEGVLVGELLKRAGVPVGAQLRGDAVATYVVASASDGYQVVFSLAELDPAFTSNDIMVADTVDGKPLFGYQGAFRIVAPQGLARRTVDSHVAAHRGGASAKVVMMKPTTSWAVCLVIGLSMFGSSPVPAEEPYVWLLPKGVPLPNVPPDNLMSDAKVALGRRLFYDTRLSGNGTQSCGSCHEQAKAFTDGRARSVGSTGQLHARGSMSLVNVAYAAILTWANPTLTRLEDQALVPMYGDHPVELGLDRAARWLDAIKQDPDYPRRFHAAFDQSAEAVTADHLVKAIAAFERSIVSLRSPYDRYHFDRDDTAISDRARRGEVLFHSRPLSCFTCHGGVHFSGAMGAAPRSMNVELHNTGLYSLTGLLSYPSSDTGLYELTHNLQDVGRFKAPTLRNVALTAPYMHDGSVATLEEAIDHYAAGGRTIASGPNQGVGRANPNKSVTLQGFPLTAAERGDLVAFLESLTDEELIHDPRFANPWVAERRN